MALADSDFSMMDNESDFENDDFSVDENGPVPGKGANSLVKATGLSVLGTNQNVANTSKPKGSGKAIESQYRKLTQREHCLVRPDTYIGSIEPVQQTMFVVDEATERIKEKLVTFTPGLFKIFDEIVVNAADNKQRDPSMDKLDVTVDAATNTISVKNNGNGIPVVMHKEHNCYVPTLIFGHLLTGSNFDDNEKKTTGGRNGYGAKLTNIFSTKFVVECVDSERGLKFEQVFEDNMSIAHEPKISKCKAAEKKAGDYTKVIFNPDLKRFKMTELDSDTVGLLSKRAFDIAGSMASRPGKKLQVTLNGKKLPIKSFQDYLKLFDGINPPVAYEQVGDRWEVGVSSTDGTASQISFVNAICTSKGGSHVALIADQIGAHLVNTIKKKNKGGAEIKPAQIKNHLCIFVNCLVDNPVFDSQTKEFLSLQKKAFGSTCKLSDKFLKQVDKSDIVDSIMSFAKFKADREMKRKGGTKTKKVTGIAKLDDANFAGTAKSKDCTLIVTEGDSAKSLAMSGLSVVGRNYYGVFPLKGKPLNVRDASHMQVMKNEEIKNIIDILGLKMGVTYDETSIKTLRYGHLMIMADQDHDGSHIKALVINMIHRFWPSLLDVPGFLQQFITPIVKASKGKNSKTFFTLPQYEEWLESTKDQGKGWKIKYYKGLGTSTSAEAKEYFSNLDLHEINFAELSKDVVEEKDNCDGVFPDQAVSSSGADLIDMVFRKTRVEDRKTWLNGLKKDTYLDYSTAQETNGIRYSDFINKELILFSKSDNARSIPHVMDGFKPSQRKVLFACFKRKLKEEIKVAQLAGYVSEHSAYHHGEASLHGTIINMAQDFCGSNNINLLTPSGQFGTRRLGGKDAASPRYVFTKLEKITRAIFHPDDDELLTYLSDDGVSIEPEFYMPVIPMVLVNGSDGIGTGWSSCINNHCPRAVIDNLKRMINGEELAPMHPYYSGFTGEIAPTDGSGIKFSVTGRIERTNDTTLVITELPVKTWTQSFKETLEKMMVGDDKKKEVEIKDFLENHTDTTVHFTVTADKAKIDEWEALPKGGLYAKFKLTSSLTNSNMNLFDTEHRIMKYSKTEDILKEFFDLRLEFYGRRKALLVQKLEKEQKMLSNKARFVEEVCSGSLIVSNRKKVELLDDLQERGYDLFDKSEKSQAKEGEAEESDDEEPSVAALSKGYEYLLGMKIWSLTFEKAEELREQLRKRTEELEELQATTPSTMWLNDLDNIVEALDERDISYQEAEKEELRARSKTQKRQATKKKTTAAAAKRATKKADEWCSDLEESDQEMEDDFDDDIEVVKKTTASRSRAPRAKPAPKRTAASKVAAPKAKVAPKPKEVPVEPPALDVEMSLSERMALLMSPSKNKVSEEKNIKPKVLDLIESDDDDLPPRGSKRPSPRNSDSDDEDFAVDSLAKATTTKKARVTKAKATKPATKPRVTKKKAAPSRKKVTTLDDDSEDEFDFDNEEIAAPAPKPAARSRRAAAKKIAYTLSSDEEGSDSDF
eukprot:Nitzschia sp. Nitz4//scaffold1_size375055//264446//269078//NITZ4_000304-RA/size375055-augustus-gene-0.688-mRNA-1//1//CDS//3329541129//7159//frame0